MKEIPGPQSTHVRQAYFIDESDKVFITRHEEYQMIVAVRLMYSQRNYTYVDIVHRDLIFSCHVLSQMFW